MKKIKKAVVFVFAMVLAVLMSIPANADILSSSKVTATINSQLQSLLKDASVDERIPVDIWLYETSTNEVREQQLLSKIGLNKSQITSSAKDVVSSEKVDEYIAVEREMYAEERARQYASIRQDYAKIQGLQDARKSGTRLFFSQYAPMISAELTSAEIKLLACDSRVQSIYYSPNEKLEDQSDISIPRIGASYTRDTLGYTGTGVKIGMIEQGTPDTSKPYFASADIICDETSAEGTTSFAKNHANTVAAILVGQETTINGVTYEGIVPDATLYATSASNSNDWRVGVEWLVSQGVHIINMSAGFLDAAYYQKEDRWVDHIAVNHSVHFVVAAGNTGWGVTSPGMAYNVITVGSIDDKNNDEEDFDVLADDSSYVEYTHPLDGTIPTNKPDLVAPGVGIYTPAYVEGIDSGTSFAAPHVTGVVAQLCQRFPSLRVLQAGVKAILTASVCHSQHAYDTDFMDAEDADNYDKFGAGVVSAKAAFETANAYRMMVGNFPANTLANTERVYSFTASAGQRVRVSLTWLHNAIIPYNESHENYELSNYVLDDLDLYVIHPEEADIHLSLSIYNNTEIIDFVAPTSGTYQMVVINRLATEQVVNYGLSWWFGEILDNN